MVSPSECQLACISDQNCAGFTYSEDGGLCGFYNSSGVERGGKKSGRISGMRDNCVSGIQICVQVYGCLGGNAVNMVHGMDCANNIHVGL